MSRIERHFAIIHLANYSEEINGTFMQANVRNDCQIDKPLEEGHHPQQLEFQRTCWNLNDKLWTAEEFRNQFEMKVIVNKRLTRMEKLRFLKLYLSKFSLQKRG
jgi:hypothetical protein